MQIKKVKPLQEARYPGHATDSPTTRLRVATGTTLLSITLIFSLAGCRMPAGKLAARPPEQKDDRIFSGRPAMEPVNPVYFDFDAAAIRPDQEENLKLWVERMKGAEKITIQIEGHCDERGTQEYNLALGEKRASAVKKYLVERGVFADNIRVISYGKERPADPAHTEEAWAKNRRAELTDKK